MKNKLNWGAEIEKLPVWTREEFNERAKQEGLIIISGIIHNVKNFIKEHPGGQALVRLLWVKTPQRPSTVLYMLIQMLLTTCWQP